MDIDNTTTIESSSGDITLHGTVDSSNSGNDNRGVEITGLVAISTNSGAIDITGINHHTSGANHEGVRLINSDIQATGSGTINISASTLANNGTAQGINCLLYTSPSPRDA